MKNLWRTSKDSINKKIGNLEVSCIMERRNVKYPRLEFKSDKHLLVILPYGFVSEEDILKRKEGWIYRKLNKIKASLERINGYKKIANGRSLVFGRFYKIKTLKGRYSLRWSNDAVLVFGPNKELALKYFKNYLREKLRKKVETYIDEFSKKLKVKYNKVFIKSQTTKWASCSSRKNLNFNIKLVALPDKVLKYVVLHEVAHLKEINHSNEFWELVERYEPNYKETEELLTGFWFLLGDDPFWKNDI
ncbi:MAG: M48 family metallopeptidase [Candidatus Diapherotrites archaeon]|nr:M48 family metallopeptidase [Candidatus Diapherotrites archaeon]